MTVKKYHLVLTTVFIKQQHQMLELYTTLEKDLVKINKFKEQQHLELKEYQATLDVYKNLIESEFKENIVSIPKKALDNWLDSELSK